MRLKLVWPAAFALAGTMLMADTAAAQQTLNFSLGYFSLLGESSRTDNDVINENNSLRLYERFDDGSPLEPGHFNGPTFGVEYLIPIGDYLEAGAGFQFSNRTVDTVYQDFERPNGDEIEQAFKLRTVPITATVRVLPLGKNAPIQPYVGAGIGIINWKYQETGDFINFEAPGRPIFGATYEASGTEIGPVAVFGVRAPIDRFMIGGEVRWQKAEGDLDTTDFLAPKIDLGGWHYQATFGVRF